MPATTGTTPAMRRFRIDASSSSRVGSYETRNERRKPGRHGVEAPAPLVRLAPPRGLDGLPGPLEPRTARGRHEVLVEEDDGVVARVALGSDEPRPLVYREPFGRKEAADARIVGHPGEGSRVRPAAPAAAGAAVVRRFVRVVQADR